MAALEKEEGYATLEQLEGYTEKQAKEEREMTQTFEHGGLAALKKLMMKKVNAWKEVKLTIAVIGNTGSGKSTYINAIRDLTAYDEGSAATGPTETTNEPKSYVHPEYPNLEFWDLPGVGSPSFPQKTYLKQVNFKIYDFFLILSAARFTENDCWLAKQIKKSGRKFFFIRTQIDAAIQGEKLSKPKSFNEGDVLQKIRSDCRTKLEKEGIEDPTVFLLSSFEKDHWDFQAAKEKIIEDFPDLKKEAIMFSLSCQTTNIIDKKKKMLSTRIFMVAIASAIGGAAPIPGVSLVTDTAIIVEETRFYKKQFGLDEKSLKLTAKSMNLSFNALKSCISQAAAMISKLAVAQTTSEAAENLVRFGIPFIGWLIAAGISYGATVVQLRRVLNETEADARALVAVLQDSVKKYAKTCLA